MESNDQAPAPQSGVTPPGAPDAAPQAPAADTPPADTADASTGDYPPPGSTPPPGTTPPGATPPGAPPPPGAQVPPPGAQPPPTGIRTLYRTREPRIIAGVCGGLARATNTDPILFRVILAVLVFFGGIGALLYVLGWLLLPLEGETASPAEALLGRGQSSTSPVITMLLGVVVVIALAASLNSGFENVILLAAVIIGVVLLLRRSGHLPENLGFPAQPAAAGPAPYTAPAPTPPAYGTPAYSAPAGPGITSTLQIPTSPPQPPLAGPVPYSSPFAPHGPYAPPIPPRPPIPPVPPPPRPPKERSILGRITFAVLCLALAGVTLIDLAGADVPFSGYAATALGITALGLLVGAWYGRGRLLIVLGIVLSIALGIGTASERIGKYTNIDEQVNWRPATVDQLQRDYRLDAGDATLDLTGLDFTDRSRDVNVQLGAGDLQIYLPPNVDVDVRAKVGVGDAQIFEGRSEGLGIDRHSSDNGIDGPGGGTLNVTIDVGVGSLEVAR